MPNNELLLKYEKDIELLCKDFVTVKEILIAAASSEASNKILLSPISLEKVINALHRPNNYHLMIDTLIHFIKYEYPGFNINTTSSQETFKKCYSLYDLLAKTCNEARCVQELFGQFEWGSTYKNAYVIEDFNRYPYKEYAGKSYHLMSVFHQKGWGVSCDQKEAEHYYTLAKKHGYKDSGELLRELHMTLDEFECAMNNTTNQNAQNADEHLDNQLKFERHIKKLPFGDLSFQGLSKQIKEKDNFYLQDDIKDLQRIIVKYNVLINACRKTQLIQTQIVNSHPTYESSLLKRFTTINYKAIEDKLEKEKLKIKTENSQVLLKNYYQFFNAPQTRAHFFPVKKEGHSGDCLKSEILLSFYLKLMECTTNNFQETKMELIKSKDYDILATSQGITTTIIMKIALFLGLKDLIKTSSVSAFEKLCSDVESTIISEPDWAAPRSASLN